MNEHGYIRSVHRHIPPPTFVWKIHDSFAGGVPDAFYCDTGGHLFVEYKYLPTLPKRAETRIIPALSALQAAWLRDRHAQNVAVAVILGTPNGGIVFTDLAWETGLLRADLDEIGLPSKDVAAIITNHCIGKSYVTPNGDQTHHHPTGSGQRQALEAAVGAA